MVLQFNFCNDWFFHFTHFSTVSLLPALHCRQDAVADETCRRDICGEWKPTQTGRTILFVVLFYAT